MFIKNISLLIGQFLKVIGYFSTFITYTMTFRLCSRGGAISLIKRKEREWR